MRLVALTVVVVVLAEVAVLVLVGRAVADHWGPGAALAVILGSILLTGSWGAALARKQGLGVVKNLQEATARGQFPGQTLVDGALILAGGVLLILPGFLTDLVGLSLLVPWTRKFYHRAAVGWLSRRVAMGEAAFRQDLDSANPDWPGDGPVIDITPADEQGSRPETQGEQGQLI